MPGQLASAGSWQWSCTDCSPRWTLEIDWTSSVSCWPRCWLWIRACFPWIWQRPTAAGGFHCLYWKWWNASWEHASGPVSSLGQFGPLCLWKRACSASCFGSGSSLWLAEGCIATCCMSGGSELGWSFQRHHLPRWLPFHLLHRLPNVLRISGYSSFQQFVPSGCQLWIIVYYWWYLSNPSCGQVLHLHPMILTLWGNYFSFESIATAQADLGWFHFQIGLLNFTAEEVTRCFRIFWIGLPGLEFVGLGFDFGDSQMSFLIWIPTKFHLRILWILRLVRAISGFCGSYLTKEMTRKSLVSHQRRLSFSYFLHFDELLHRNWSNFHLDSN